jgi:predicted nucleic acid-binding protein
VRLYLDASVLVALFTEDPLSLRAESLLCATMPVVVVVSDFAAAEFASALARRVRTGDIRPKDARTAFAKLDAWTAHVAERIDIAPADVTVAQSWLRRLDLTLRTPDALNIAIAQRAGAALATFDAGMAACARALGSMLANDVP